MKNARELSFEAVKASDLWLGLFADDAITEDSVGKSASDLDERHPVRR